MPKQGMPFAALSVYWYVNQKLPFENGIGLGHLNPCEYVDTALVYQLKIGQHYDRTVIMMRPLSCDG